MLLIPSVRGTNFLSDEVRSAIESLQPDAQFTHSKNEFEEFAWSGSFRGRFVSGAFQPGGVAVSLDPENETAVALAFALSKSLSVPADIIDDEYTYRLTMSSYAEPNDLWEAIRIAHESSTGDEPQPVR